MTTPAARARETAISIEGKKDGLYQKKGADWVVRFTIQSADLCEQLKDSPLGTRYAIVLVEIDDNEEPKDGTGRATAGVDNYHAVSANPSADVPVIARKPVVPEKRLAQQAALCCKDPLFWKFLEERKCNYGLDPMLIDNEHRAAEAVKYICGGIQSRKEIVPVTHAGLQWANLYSSFRLWVTYPDLSPASREREKEIAPFDDAEFGMKP